MSRLECGHLGLEPATGEPQVSDKIQKLMSSAFIREMKFKVVEIAVVVYREFRDVEQGGKSLYLLRLDRVLDVPEEGIRREGAVLGQATFEKVAARLRAEYSWS